MTDDQAHSNRRVIHATCTQCRGVARGFTNLVVRKLEKCNARSMW